MLNILRIIKERTHYTFNVGIETILVKKLGTDKLV